MASGIVLCEAVQLDYMGLKRRLVMSKLVYLLTIFTLAFTTYTFADDEQTCPEGSVLDPDTGTCVEQSI